MKLAVVELSALIGVGGCRRLRFLRVIQRGQMSHTLRKVVPTLDSVVELMMLVKILLMTWIEPFGIGSLGGGTHRAWWGGY